MQLPWQPRGFFELLGCSILSCDHGSCSGARWCDNHNFNFTSLTFSTARIAFLGDKTNLISSGPGVSNNYRLSRLFYEYIRFSIDAQKG